MSEGVSISIGDEQIPNVMFHRLSMLLNSRFDGVSASVQLLEGLLEMEYVHVLLVQLTWLGHEQTPYKRRPCSAMFAIFNRGEIGVG